MSPSLLPVLIIGTGPSGLLLSHALKKASIPFQLYERDPAISTRAQGYRVKLHGPGALALQDVLSPQHFQTLKRACGIPQSDQKFVNLDALTADPALGGPQFGKGNAKLETGTDNGKLEPLGIDRQVLRSVLARGLENEIQYGHEIKAYTLSPDNTSVTAAFTNGVSATGSLLVAADGAWSRVRRQYLPGFNPVDTEARFLYGKTPITTELRQTFNPAAMKATTLITDRSSDIPVSLILEPMVFDHALAAEEGVHLPYDYVYWALGSRADRLDMSSLGEKPNQEAYAAFSRELVQKWHPSFQALFEHQDVSQTTFLSIGSMAPPMPSWEASRVTLIGDAAHCMSPSAGVGATTALRDAGFLGQLLADEGVSVEAVGKYEKEMRGWAEQPIEKSVGMGKMIWGMRDFGELKPFDTRQRMNDAVAIA